MIADSNLLRNLQKLPPRDRLKALQAEMGAVQLASGLSPEQWLRSKVHLYYFLGFAVLFLSFVILFVVAATSQLPGTIYIGIAIIAFTVLLLIFTVRRMEPSRTVEVDITPFNDAGPPR
jgi:predicted lysophospholipase L1 biosynthesis ABC-type transport system permease subunit